MSRDALVKVERNLVAQHTQIDRALRRIAVAHAALDADEAHWLRIAEEQRIWPKLGYVHGFEYLEDVFGYAPRTASERLRVARELGDLPQLEDALRCGVMSWSVVRELTRVATPATVDHWIEEARGRRLRDVEQMVAGRKKGDEPGTPPDPKRVKHRVVLELDGESLVIWRQMHQVVEAEDDCNLDDRAFVLALGARILSVADCANDSRTVAANENDNENENENDNENDNENETPTSTTPTRKPMLRSVPARYMVHVTTCRDCGRGWQDGAGVRVELDRSAVDRAQCNAVICDDEKGQRPSRTIPARIERLVLERAQQRCEVPGCRSSKHLAIHHIELWANGGTHDLWNLIVLCDGHHRVLHDGLLKITGRAPDQLVFERNGSPLAGHDTHATRKHVTGGAQVKKPMTAPNLKGEDPVALAQAALRQLGFKAQVAARAVDAACAHVGPNVELGALIKEALRQCGK
ncbi:MAG TPA: HNH endonuclease signature motif containing protein [Kofleriaceae bacterium]|nr:HNH endonuclease signature motif containing protein [Kofleriaceae bacterium]